MGLYAFDGTWQRDEIDDERDTNVRRFFEAYTEQKFYTPGVGTRWWLPGRWLGGVVGAGGRSRIKKAYTHLKQQYLQGDRTIDIIGFSRGAALALHFANRVYNEGPIAPGEGQPPGIRFLGLWDVVASFGIPGNPINLGWDLGLPKNVKACFHALALDERRGNFRPTRVEGAHEVWFRGVHSDIGGGNGNTLLSNISLRWMMRRASQVGVPLDLSKLPLDGSIDVTAAIRPSRLDPIKDPYRSCRQTDRRHYTVSDRADCNNPPAGILIETEIDEWPGAGRS